MAFITLSPKLRLVYADCRNVLRELPDNFIDSCVTDPPYGIGFMGKEWDQPGSFVEIAMELFRVLKPGAHLVAFGASRGYHRMACAIEDAGFEIRDSLMWIYGSGFPKSHDVSKGLDRAAGAERELTRAGVVQRTGYGDDWDTGSSTTRPRFDHPATDAAREWQGWGTALKPAFEPIVLARKPLSEPTIAANVLKWGTGALNIDGCRVNSGPVEKHVRTSTITDANSMSGTSTGSTGSGEFVEGRWPANVCHDGSDEVVGMFPNARSGEHPANRAGLGYHGGADGTKAERVVLDKGGSAARFFYSAKANAKDRAGSKHPTVKPIALMQWLARLITPPGGVILDPFAGSGTTGAAAAREGFTALLCEREEEYVRDIMRRFGVGASA